MTGAMHTAAQSLPSAILALLPSPHLRDSLKALRFLLLQGHGKARPQHSQTKSPASCIAAPGPPAWPGRKRKQPCTWPGEDDASVLLDRVTLEQRGPFPLPPLFFSTASGACIWWRFTWSTVTFGCPGSSAPGEVKAGRALPSWPCGFSRPCPPGGGRPLVFGWWGCGGIGGRGRVSAS